MGETIYRNVSKNDPLKEMVSDVNYENFTFPANLKKKKNGKTTDGKARKKIIKSFTWDTSVATEYTCNGLIDLC